MKVPKGVAYTCMYRIMVSVIIPPCPHQFIVHSQDEVYNFHFLFSQAPFSPVHMTQGLSVQLLQFIIGFSSSLIIPSLEITRATETPAAKQQSKIILALGRGVFRGPYDHAFDSLQQGAEKLENLYVLTKNLLVFHQQRFFSIQDDLARDLKFPIGN